MGGPLHTAQVDPFLNMSHNGLSSRRRSTCAHLRQHVIDLFFRGEPPQRESDRELCANSSSRPSARRT